MRASEWRTRLAHRLPFYYGWIIFAVSAAVSYSSRPTMAVATLSVFLVPMTEEFGWSRGVFAGAVSLGGICAVAISPLVGWWIDRHGSGMIIAVAGAVSGACALGLSLVSNAWAFYALYVPGRMAFASPLELGASTAVSNWFIRRRAFAFGALNVTHGMGLALMPLAAYLIIAGWSWRTAWAAMGIFTLAVGVLPALLFIARRPEDMGLAADPRPELAADSLDPSEQQAGSPVSASPEPAFTLRQALNTRAFWFLAFFSAGGFMVQAGVSLHQAAHYLQRGLSGSGASLSVSVFAFSQVPGGLMWSSLARWVPLRILLAFAGLTVAAGALGTTVSSTLPTALASATTLGVGVGGLHVLLSLVWADYYGRWYLGSIRGVTLPIQIAGQAIGPIFAGFAYDARDSYQLPFIVFAAVVSMASLLVLSATPPGYTSRRAPPASTSLPPTA